MKKSLLTLLAINFVLMNTSAQHLPIRSLQINPDEGIRIFSASTFKNSNFLLIGASFPILWNPNNGEIIREYRGHDEFHNPRGLLVISEVDISNSQEFIVSGDEYRNIVVHDLMTGTPISKMKSTNNTPLGSAFIDIHISSDNKFIISGSGNGAIELWNPLTGDLLKQLNNRGTLSSLILLPNNEEILVSTGGTKLINIDNDETIFIFPGGRPFISDDGKILQVLEGNQFDGFLMAYYDLITYEKIREIPLGLGPIPSAIDMSPDGKYFLLGNSIRQNGTTTITNRVLYDAVTPGPIRTYEADENADPNSPFSTDSIIKFFPDGKKFLTVNGNTVHIWDISDVVTNVEHAHLHEN